MLHLLPAHLPTLRKLVICINNIMGDRDCALWVYSKSVVAIVL